MNCSKLARVFLYNFRSLSLSLSVLVFATAYASAVAAASQAPSNVSALLYSTTAAELFWTPSDGQRVRVERNGELLGVYDASSLFQSGLNPSQQYRYVLQSVNSNGERSPSWQVDIAPGNHPLANNRINASQGNAPVVLTDTSSNNQAEPQIQAQSPQAPSNVSALLHSNTAAELFWTPSNGQRVRVERNGELLGVYDARSLFQPGLNPSEQYRFVLQSVNSNGERSPAWQIDIAPGNHPLSNNRINAVHTGAPVVLNDAPVVNQPEPQPEPQPQPQPQPQAGAQTISPNPNPVSGCEVRNLGDLARCISNNDSTVTVLNDLNCSGGNCCPSNTAILSLQGKRNITIDGNGHRLLRQTGQRSCSLLDINSSTNITLRNWRLDDDANVAGCQVTDRCPRTLHIRQSKNVQLENMHISNGKSYAIYVHQVNGFAFKNSSLTNSGVLGLYVGHGDNTPSRGVVIENSTFRDNQTNALALLGVTGSRMGENRVANNLFIRNHRRGQWRVAPSYGSGFTGGGQVFIAQASYVDFDNNQILDGYCDNCFIQRLARSGVSGLELGLTNKNSLSNLRIRNNVISNHDRSGISHSQNNNLNNVRLENNTLVNNTLGDHTTGASKSGMVVSNTELFDSFESNGGVKTGAYCSNTAYAQRQCGVASRHGSCVMRLHLAGSDCAGSNASVSSDWRPVAEFRRVFLNGWVNRVGGGQANGQWCLEFANSNRDVINTRCKPLSEVDRSSVQAFVGSPSLDVISPQSSRFVRYRVTLNGANSTLDVDDVKLSID